MNCSTPTSSCGHTWNLCLILLCCTKAFGASSIWTNSTDGLWRVGTNWTQGAPTNNVQAWITNANSKTVTIDPATPADNLTVARIQLWAPANTTNTLSLEDL